MVSWMWMCLQVNGWVNGQQMEWMWLCCMSSVQHRLKTELFSVAMKHIYIYIYYDRSVCVRETRETDKREKMNKECPFGRLLSTSVWLAWMGWKDTNNKPPTTHKPTTLHLDSGHMPYLIEKHGWSPSSKKETTACKLLTSLSHINHLQGPWAHHPKQYVKTFWSPPYPKWCSTWIQKDVLTWDPMPSHHVWHC